MAEVTVPLRNPSGLHARPAALFVKTAMGFTSQIKVANLTRDAATSVSAKSVLGILSLGVSKGHEVRISAQGDDAEEALRSLTDLVETGLGEQIEA